MPISVQRTSSLDVSQKNPNKILYIFGDDTTDGSIRLILDDGDTVGHISQRRNGVWNDTSFRFNSSSIFVGRDMIISAVAGHLETTNPSAAVGHTKGLIPHIEFDDGGTSQVESPIVKAEELFTVFGTAVSEIIGTTIGINIGTTPGRIIEHSFHEVGTVGASEDVVVSFYTGTDNTGFLFNRRNLPPSDLIANTTLDIDYDLDLGFEANVGIFQEFTSTANFSLKTDSGGNPLTIHEAHELKEIGVISENIIYDNSLGHVLDNSFNPVYENQF